MIPTELKLIYNLFETYMFVHIYFRDLLDKVERQEDVGMREIEL